MDTSPPSDLSGYDLFDPVHERVKWALFATARKQCPVIRRDGTNDHIVTRYEDVRRVLRDPDTFSSVGVSPRPSPVSLNPIDIDPPLHTELRKLLNPIFAPNHVRKFEPYLRETAANLVDGFMARGKADLVGDYAAPLVGHALARVVFNDDNTDRMRDAARLVTAVATEPTEESFMRVAALAADYIAEREAKPRQGDDLLNVITHGTVGDGRRLTNAERLGVVTILFLGGLDTTRGAIGSIAYHLACRPDLEKRLRDENWARRDLDEFLRLESPVACLGRLVTRETELGGVTLREGERVLLRYDSANRDDHRFPDGSELRFDRPSAGHVGFGFGIHHCLGANFARLQIRVAFDELLNRVTRLRFESGSSGDVEWSPGPTNGPLKLDVLFDPTA